MNTPVNADNRLDDSIALATLSMFITPYTIDHRNTPIVAFASMFRVVSFSNIPMINRLDYTINRTTKK